MNQTQTDILMKIMTNVGDMGFKRRIYTILEYLDIQPGDKVLDCGCGEGFYSMILNELYACQVTALDADEPLLAIARQRVGPTNKVEFKIGDVNKLPFPDEFFDKIILSEVLEHISDDYAALMEVKRVLKKGGIIAITVPNHNYPFNWDPVNKIREGLGLGHFKKGLLAGLWNMHLRLYYPEDLKKLVEKAELNIEDIRGVLHYCIPFNHNVLRFFKVFYTSMPLPKTIHDSMEKFSWKDEKPKSAWWNPVPHAKHFLEWVDRKNDNFRRLDQSSMCVTVKARKP